MSRLLRLSFVASLVVACATDASAAGVQGRRRPHHRHGSRSSLAPELAVLRTRELHAGRLRARVIHARSLHADSGRVRKVLPEDADSRREEARESRIEAAEIVADVIYADSVEAGHVDAREVHAAEVTIGGKAR